MALGALFLHKQKLNPSSTSNDWITFAGIVPCFLVIASSAGDGLISFAGALCFGWAIYASCLIFLFYEEPLRGMIRKLLSPQPRSERPAKIGM